MDVKARRSLQFDNLEDRVYLSVTHAGRPHPTALKGSIQVSIPGDSGSAGTVNIVGNGNVSPLGPVNALGTLTSDAHGGGGGVVNLAGGDGGIVLRFQVSAGRGRHATPHIRFTVNGGTGSFTNATGQGTATEALGASPETLVLKIRGTLKSGA